MSNLTQGRTPFATSIKVAHWLVGNSDHTAPGLRVAYSCAPNSTPACGHSQPLILVIPAVLFIRMRRFFAITTNGLARLAAATLSANLGGRGGGLVVTAHAPA